MNYIFDGTEIIVNKITFLKKVISDNYDYFNFNLNPIYKNNPIDESTVKNEIQGAKNLWIEDLEINQVTPFTFNIYSEKLTDIVLFFDSTSPTKLWLNDEIIFSKNDYVSGIYCRTLKKGCNIFYGEFYSYSNSCLSFICRVSNYNTENSRYYNNIINSISSSVNNPSVDFFVLDNDSYMSSIEYADCIFPRDIFRLNVNSDILLEVFPGNSDEPIDSLKLRYNQKYILNLDKYRSLLNPNVDEIVLKYKFEEYDGKIQVFYRMFIIRDFIDKAIDMITKEKSIDMLWTRLYNSIEVYKQNPQRFYSYYTRLMEKYSLSHYNKANLHGGNIPERNVKRYYFQSKLDGKIDQYLIREPTKFDETKKYPLFLFISTGPSSDYSYYITNNNYFVADASGRGVTGGSYIGEACLLEILSHIKQNYNIDDKKIYLLGFSNGAYASINLLENYPDMFAGTFTLAASSNDNLLCNIQDKKCINIYSQFDDSHKNKCFPENISVENFKDIECPILNHKLLNYYIAQRNAIEDLLKEELKSYPNHIHAKTYSLRHKKYYWFEFLDIAFGLKYAEVDILIYKNNKIKIDIKNCDRFKLYIPPQIKKQNIEFNINGQIIKISETVSASLTFENINNVFYLSEDKIKPLSLKGTGLLDVYYGPLQIYISNKDDISGNIAKNFSAPFTNGYDPQIYAEYPITTIGNFDINRNAILIDNFSNNNFSISIRSNLFIQLHKDGFEYKDKNYDGDYCILQIIHSPFNNDRTILHISTNNKKLLQKNIFLRKVVFSFDVNGLNPYWNNEALIFYNNRYYKVYERGSEIEPCN